MSDTLLQNRYRLDAELGRGGKVVLQVSLRAAHLLEGGRSAKQFPHWPGGVKR